MSKEIDEKQFLKNFKVSLATQKYVIPKPRSQILSKRNSIQYLTERTFPLVKLRTESQIQLSAYNSADALPKETFDYIRLCNKSIVDKIIQQRSISVRQPQISERAKILKPHKPTTSNSDYNYKYFKLKLPSKKFIARDLLVLTKTQHAFTENNEWNKQTYIRKHDHIYDLKQNLRTRQLRNSIETIKTDRVFDENFFSLVKSMNKQSVAYEKIKRFERQNQAYRNMFQNNQNFIK